MQTFLVIIGIVLCVAGSAFFSGSEMALSSCNEIRMESQAKNGRKKPALVLKLLQNFDETLCAILVGNNLVNIAASTLTTVLIILLTGEDALNWLGTLLVTITIIILGETVPKILSKRFANRFAAASSRPIRFWMLLCKPLNWIVVGLVSLLTHGIKGEEEDSEESVEELQSIIETAEDEGVLDSDQTELVSAAIDFADIPVEDVMTARVDVEALDVDDDPEAMMQIVLASGHSRLPVYEESLDHCIGVVHLNHLLKAWSSSVESIGLQDDSYASGRNDSHGNPGNHGDLSANGESAAYGDLSSYEEWTSRGSSTFYRHSAFSDQALVFGQNLPPVQKVDLRSLVMKPLFIYRTVKLPQALDQMKASRAHLAIVTDEFSGTLGIITMEDILEQIVGEIWDENDTVEEAVEKMDNGQTIISGDLSIDEFLELMDMNPETFEYESSTVGGWVTEYLERFPQEGDSFDYEQFTVKVLKMDERRVEKIVIVPADHASGQPEE